MQNPGQLAGHQLLPPEPNFRWRGGDITRLEAFSDAVFAFAVTLLIVSLEVPRTFSQLALTMRGFLAFAVCFALLAHIWHMHYIYSRRYGLQTPYSVFLNLVLLFVILFYVYPLKFMFALALGGFGSPAETPGVHIRAPIETNQVPSLVMGFSLGYAAVFTVFCLLYLYAYRKRRELQLNEYETLRTRHEMISHTVIAAVGVLTAVTARLLPPRISFFSVFLLCLSVVYGLIAKPIFSKREQLALERMQASARAAAT